jgi:hypothetical protein
MRVRARLGARSLWPSPPLHTGRHPRCSGFRGWSRSVPPLAAFGPQDSCLRFAQAVPGLDARRGPSDPMARRVAGGTSYATPGRRSPTGKRRLSPAHATYSRPVLREVGVHVRGRFGAGRLLEHHRHAVDGHLLDVFLDGAGGRKPMMTLLEINHYWLRALTPGELSGYSCDN